MEREKERKRRYINVEKLFFVLFSVVLLSELL